MGLGWSVRPITNGRTDEASQVRCGLMALTHVNERPYCALELFKINENKLTKSAKFNN